MVAIGVTGNYVGLLERGVRNPSPELLRKISEAMDVPYDWLVNGGPLSSDARISQNGTADATSDPVQSINPQLFLSLVLSRSPNVSKKMVAAMLMIPVETIDAILTGQSVDLDPRWNKAFSVLAQTLDLTVVRKGVLSLDAFLEQEEIVQNNAALLCALQTYVKKDGNFKIVSIDGQEPDIATTHKPYGEVRMHGGGDSPYDWNFKRMDSNENTPAEDVVDGMARFAEQNNCKVTIVVTSAEDFDKLCDYYSRLETENDALAELDESHCRLRDVSVLFFNQETGDVFPREFQEDEFDSDT